jgi:hypothetical protein
MLHAIFCDHGHHHCHVYLDLGAIFVCHMCKLFPIRVIWINDILNKFRDPHLCLGVYWDLDDIATC